MRVLEYFLGFLLMKCLEFVSEYLNHLSKIWNFGCGIFLFQIGKQFLEMLGLVFLFGFGLRLLRFKRLLSEFGGKSDLFTKGFLSKDDLDMNFCSQISSGKYRTVGSIENLQDNLDKNHPSDCDPDAEDFCGPNHDFDENWNKYCDEDDVFDVLVLRKLVKIEKSRSKSAILELEKERAASATAAEEAMAMILRLQNEKSLIEMEAKQYKRLAEEKQLHDQEVIQSLQWLVLKHQSERSLLEEQLRFYQKKMRMQSNADDELEEFEDNGCSIENAIANSLDNRLFSSLDMDLLME